MLVVSNALKVKAWSVLGMVLILFLAKGGYGGAEKDKPGSAQHPLTLEDCIRIALESSPVAAASDKGVLAAKEALGEARSPYYPEVVFQARYAYWQQRAFLPSGLSLPGRPTPTLIGPTDDWMTGVRMRYTLFDGGERRAQYRAAVARAGLAEEEKIKIRQDLILGVYQGFYGVAAALETLKTAEKNLSRAEDHVRLAEERKAVGAVSRADVLRVQVEKANAELARIRAENLVRLAKGNLNTIMGLPAERPLELVFEQEAAITPDWPDLSQALDQALRQRPEVRAAERRVQAGGEGVKAVKSAFGPKIRLEGSYGRRDTEVFLDEEEWLAGISFEWPLFTGFSRQHRLARARAELAREEAEAAQVCLKVRQEVWNAYGRLQETYAALKTSQIAAEQAEESLRLARERYEVGAGTVAELLDAEAALVRAQAGQVEARWDYRTARAVFQRAVGKIGDGEKF